MPIPTPPGPVPFGTAQGCCQPCPIAIGTNLILVQDPNNLLFLNLVGFFSATTIIKV